MSGYKNAYEAYRLDSNYPISETAFYALITDFQKSFLSSVKYPGGLNKHRKPLEFLGAILHKLHEHDQKIQARRELKDYNKETETVRGIPASIIDIKNADRDLSLYKSICIFCEQRKVHLNTTLVHLAEYRAINRLIRKIRIHINKEKSKRMIERAQEVRTKNNNDKIFCYNCKCETKQELLFREAEIIGSKESVSFDENRKRKGSAWIIEGRIWKVFKCKGCEKINLNVFVRYDPVEEDKLIHHFPTKDFRPFPMWATHLSADYLELFAEIYSSLNMGNIRLAIMGARTLLDMFIVEKVTDRGRFQAKLQKLVDEKYITPASRELLEVALEYGHATIHRAFHPTENQVNDIMDIIENILHAEALKDKTKELKENVPKKASSKK